MKPGTVINNKYIILGKDNYGIYMTTNYAVAQMEFGGTNDYRESNIRGYLENDYFDILKSKFGEENIKLHKIDLTALDGTSYGVIDAYVSLFTLDRYRKYREFIDPDFGGDSCLATPHSIINNELLYVEDVSGYVYSYEADDFEENYCMRPFFVLQPLYQFKE